MYIPSAYKFEDQKLIQEFISNHGFAILVSHQNQLVATHLPLVIDSKGEYLEGHVSKLNPQVEHFQHDQEVMAIFSGAHGYISSSWYEKEDVPTWNYLAVHVYGKVEILSEKETLEAMSKLVDKYEADVKSPQSMADWAEKTVQQVRGIVAFRIKIKDIQAVKKLSQNHSDNDKVNIIQELEDRGENALAEQMRENARKSEINS